MPARLVDAYQDGAVGLVSAPPSPALSGTSWELVTGGGARMPSVPFEMFVRVPGVLPVPGVTLERVRVGARNGEVLSSITRNSNGKGAIAIAAGYECAATISSRTMDDLLLHGGIDPTAPTYGCKADGTTDDTDALQAACTALGTGQTLALPPQAVIAASTEINCRDKQFIKIVGGYGAQIKARAGSSWTATQAILDLAGTRHSRIDGLRVSCDLASNRPGAGVVFGRATLDGTHMRVDDLFVDGAFQVAPVYNCGAEVFRCFGGLWYSTQAAIPAYLDIDDDAQYGLANGIANSNKMKKFYGVQMANQAQGDVETVVVILQGYNDAIGFHGCYLHSLGNLAAHFFRLNNKASGGNDVTSWLHIHECDFEQNNGTSLQHAGTRLIHCSKTNGLSGLDIKTQYLKGWNPAGAEYLLEVTAASLLQSDITYYQAVGGSKLVRVLSPAQFRANRVYGLIQPGSIVVDGASASSTENEVHHALAGNPFTFVNGATEFSTGDALLKQDNLVFSSGGNDASVSIPVARKRMGVFTSGDTTPSVRGLEIYETANTAPTSITAFDTAETGQHLTIFVKDANTTFVHTAANNLDVLKLDGGVNWAAPNGAVIEFQRDDRTATGYWRETSRRLPALEADVGALTDNSGGTADNTIQAIPNPADAPADADALREDLVANILPALRNNIADLTEQNNALRTALRNRGIMA